MWDWYWDTTNWWNEYWRGHPILFGIVFVVVIAFYAWDFFRNKR